MLMLWLLVLQVQSASGHDRATHSLVGLRREPTAQFAVREVGNLGGSLAEALGVNNSGVVVGLSKNRRAEQRPFRYYAGQTSDLGGLIRMPIGVAFNVNDSGEIVGLAGDGRLHTAAFCIKGHKAQFLQAPGGEYAEARASNRTGAVVGVRTDRVGRCHAFLFTKHHMVSLPCPKSAMCEAVGISDKGLVGGFISVPHGISLRSTACVWRGGRLTQLHVPGASTSMATSVSPAGTVVGEARDASGRSQAFTWCAERMRVIAGPRGSSLRGLGVNDVGEVVGEAAGPGRKTWAFLCRAGRVIDLNSTIHHNSGWHLNTASAISKRGSIVGCGLFHGCQAAFLLTPTSSSAYRR